MLSLRLCVSNNGHILVIILLYTHSSGSTPIQTYSIVTVWELPCDSHIFLTYNCHCVSCCNPIKVLSCRDPHPIAEIPSDPRLIPYHSSNSIPTILRDSDTTLTKPLNSNHPPSPPTHYYCSLRTPNDLGEPWSHSCLHLSSSFCFSPLELRTCLHVLISVFTFPFLIY